MVATLETISFVGGPVRSGKPFVNNVVAAKTRLLLRRVVKGPGCASVTVVPAAATSKQTKTLDTQPIGEP